MACRELGLKHLQVEHGSRAALCQGIDQSRGQKRPSHQASYVAPLQPFALGDLCGVDRSTRHVKNGICCLGLVGKRLDRFVRGQNQQIDSSPAGLEFYLLHHGKRSISSGAEYEALALPGYRFLDRDRGMSELLAESFRGLLLAPANPAAVNDDVTFISNAINFNCTEVKLGEVHGRALRFKR